MFSNIKKVISNIPFGYYPLIALIAFLFLTHSPNDYRKQSGQKNSESIVTPQYITKSLDFGKYEKVKQKSQIHPIIFGYKYPYIVKKGDCLWDIARRTGTTPNKLRFINNIEQSDRIYIGQIIYTPKDITQNLYYGNKAASDPQEGQSNGRPPFIAENDSYYGQLNDNGIPKTVFVSGYYRKDGTYVRSHYRSPPGSNAPSTNSTTANINKSLESTNNNTTVPRVAENGSYYGEPSKLTGRPKTVHVRGYYRKDGTYVRGHYRSKGR